MSDDDMQEDIGQAGKHVETMQGAGLTSIFDPSYLMSWFSGREKLVDRDNKALQASTKHWEDVLRAKDWQPEEIFLQSIDACNYKPEFSHVKKLGRGGFGVVELFQLRQPPHDYVAIKELHGETTKEAFLDAQWEARYWRDITICDEKKNMVVPLLHAYVCKQTMQVAFVMPTYGAPIDVWYVKVETNVYKDKGYLEWSNAPYEHRLLTQYVQPIATHIYNMVEWLHNDCGFIHRDMYARNLLMDDTTNLPRLADFGMAIENGEKNPNWQVAVKKAVENEQVDTEARLRKQAESANDMKLLDWAVLVHLSFTNLFTKTKEYEVFAERMIPMLKANQVYQGNTFEAWKARKEKAKDLYGDLLRDIDYLVNKLRVYESSKNR